MKQNQTEIELVKRLNEAEIVDLIHELDLEEAHNLIQEMGLELIQIKKTYVQYSGQGFDSLMLDKYLTISFGELISGQHYRCKNKTFFLKRLKTLLIGHKTMFEAKSLMLHSLDQIQQEEKKYWRSLQEKKKEEGEEEEEEEVKP